MVIGNFAYELGGVLRKIGSGLISSVCPSEFYWEGLRRKEGGGVRVVFAGE